MPQLTTSEWQSLDSAHYLHPFTDYKQLAAKGARIVTRADGVYIYTSEGDKILDGMSGLWCVALGYGRKELSDAAYKQMLELPYYNSFFQSTTTPAIELARLLKEVTPPQFNHVFYTGSGSEANDTLLRLVRRYWQLLDQPERNVIISRWNGYHGSTVAGASLGGMKAMHEQLGPNGAVPGIVHINQPYWFGEGGDLSPAEFGLKCARELEAKILEVGPHRDRGVHRRAGAGRRRAGDPAGDLLARDPEDRRQVRNPVRVGRSDLRFRAHGAVVRLRTLRHAPGLHDHGEGAVVRLSTDRRADGRRPGRERPDRQGRRVFPWIHLFRASGGLRGRHRQSRDLPPRAHRRAGPRRGRTLSSSPLARAGRAPAGGRGALPGSAGGHRTRA